MTGKFNSENRRRYFNNNNKDNSSKTSFKNKNEVDNFKLNKINFDFVATTLNGLEDVLAKELLSLGAKKIVVKKRAVEFNGDKKLLYKANLNLRTAIRILKPVFRFSATDEQTIYNKVKSIAWEKYFSVNDTFAIDAIVHSKYFHHSKYISLKTKDAVADRFREKFNKRPSVETNAPTYKIVLHVQENEATILFDSSGEPLSRRGYRTESNEAPLNEVLAAGMILLTGWDRKSDFVDPMSGSGTIPIEAGLIAKNIAPGIFRKFFGFMNWDDFDEELWASTIKEAINNEEDSKANIFASDISEVNVTIIKSNIAKVDLEDLISVSCCDIKNLKPFNSSSGVAVINPPYGIRLKLEKDIEFYHMIGDSLKQSFNNFDVWIISSNKEALKNVGLRASKRLTLFNGPLESKFHKFEIYKGSKKRKYKE